MFKHSRGDFPDGFIFGAATAAHQIEGGWTDGRGPSIWDTFARTQGNVTNGDTAEIATDHYNRWETDLDLLRDAGFDGYRFSIAWPRLIPEGTGAVNPKGLDFYDRLIDGMLERGLKPLCTLYHWDLPSALQDKGGWMNRDIAGWFADYAALVQREFGDRFFGVATINEPWCVSFLGHFNGHHAPGYRDMRAWARSAHHVLLAHGASVAAVRAEGAKNVGIVLNLQKCEPASEGPEDTAASHLFDGVINRWFLDGVFKGKYPDDVVAKIAEYLPADFESDMGTVSAPLDFLGMNYYSRSLLAYAPERGAFPIKDVPARLETTEMGWEIYPQGLTDLLVRVSRDYTKKPIYITENGMAEVEGVNDARRVAYLDAHMGAQIEAIRQGVDLRGYFTWSLIDNFEWAHGNAKRFGLVEIDFQTMERRPRQSWRAYQGMLHNTRGPR